MARAQKRLAQRDKAGAHPPEDFGDAGAGRTGFVIVQKRVIDIAPAEAASRQRLPGLAFQCDDPFERRQEMGDIVLRPRLGPDALRHAGQARDLCRKTGRDAGIAPVGARDQRDGTAAGRIGRFGPVDPFAHPRVGPPGVQNALDRRHLLGPLFGGARRHHGFLVPSQPPGDLPQRLGLALVFHEVGKCGHLVPRTD